MPLSHFHFLILTIGIIRHCIHLTL
uniref:Uncharacterized protein n=1 Tax=Anguilla anguilla TaxID=7936 RepID=A0A0E9UBC9_ANGAN